MTRQYVCLPSTPTTDGCFSLITVQDSHVESIRGWRNAQTNVLRQSAPISFEEQLRYYERNIWPSLDDPQPPNTLLTILEGAVPIGYGGLIHVAWEHRRAEVSFLLAEPHTRHPHRYASVFAAYLKLVAGLAFDHLGLARLHTETFATRVHHVATLEANGFRLEGTLRKHVLLGGRPVDALVHGRLRDDP